MLSILQPQGALLLDGELRPSKRFLDEVELYCPTWFDPTVAPTLAPTTSTPTTSAPTTSAPTSAFANALSTCSRLCDAASGALARIFAGGAACP